jgi:diguanylate cyclase (GGDEF)-like protein/PAS domain S-box-containing protein
MTDKGKILAVDDTPTSLRLLTDILKAEGYEVRSAINGELALQAAKSNPPELILLDIRMPEMDGYEVCRRLKAWPETCEVPVIFVTAATETEEKVHGFEMGAVDYVTKPYQRDELLARVRTHLELTRLRNRLEYLVTERTAELIQSETNLNQAQAVGHIGSWVLDISSSRMNWSAETYRIFDIRPQEVIDQATFISFVHPDDRDFVMNAWNEAMTRDTPFDIEHRIVVSEQSRWVRECAKIERDPEGRMLKGIGTVQDITARKQTDAERDRLLNIIGDATDFISTSDMEGHIKSLNPAGIRMVGLPENTDISILEIKNFHPVWAAMRISEEAIPTVLKQGSWQGESALLHRDGHEIPTSQLVLVHRDASGNPQYLSTIIRDVSERKLAEIELTNNRNRYQGILHNMMDAYWRVDENGRIVEANFAISKMHGYSIEDLLQMSVSDFEVIESKEDTRKHIETIKREGHDFFESRHRCKDGRIIDVEISANLSLDDPGHVDAFHRDITERKQATAKIKKSERQLKESQKVAKLGSWDLDLIAQKLGWSDETYELFDQSPENFSPSFDEFARLVHPDDRETMQTSFDRALASDAFPYHVEVRIINKSGRQWVMEAFGAVKRDFNGKPLSINGTAQDITERKLMEMSVERERIRLQTILKTASDGIHILDHDGVLVEANDAFLNMLGLDHSAIGKLRVMDWEAQSSWTESKARIDGLMASHGKVIFETRHRRRDGVVLDVEINASGIEIEGKGFVYAASRDITERKRAERALVEIEERFNLFMDTLPAAVFIKNEEGAYIYVNRYVVDHFGEMDWIGKSDRDIFPLELAEKIHADDLRVLETGLVVEDEQIPGADGQPRLLEARKFRIPRQGLPPFIGGITLDFTEQRRNAEQYRSVIQASLDGYWVTDTLGRILEANDSICRMHGYSREELLRMSISDIEADETPEETAAHIREMMDKGHVQFEARHKRKDGSIANVEVSIMHVTTLGDRFFAFIRDITERKQAENILRGSEARFRVMLENELVGIATVKDRIIQWANPAFEKLFGYEKGEMNGVPARVIFLNDDDYRILGEKYYPVINAGEVFRTEQVFQRKDGSQITVELNGGVLNPETGESLWILVDITERKKAEESLHITASVFDNAQEAIMITDANNTIIDVNAAFARITGYSREETLGSTPKMLSSGRQEQVFFTQMWQSLEQERFWRGEIWNRRKSGEIYAEMLSISAIFDNEGKVKRYVAVFSDISHIKAHEDELRRVAYYDALTGIPNRALLADRMKQSIAQTAREQNMMAVCYLDLDGFKPINDTFGHEAGDQVLIEVANRIGKTIRGGDTVARLGGDEFVILLLGLEKGEECASTLERLLVAISQPITIKSKSNKVTASIGVSIYPLDEEDPDTLFRHADQAMYIAKQSGKNRFHIYDPAIDRYARDQHEFLEHIRHALIKHEFVLYYQPKVNMRTGEIIGAEALIRWQHPEKGLLPPAEFLPMIEEHSLATEVGEWVIDTALTQMELWRTAGLDIPVSVNVGAHQLQQPDFVQRLTALLAAHPAIRHGCLELEVLETSALDDLSRASKIIKTCQEIGVMFALDDFGTGYSSLTYLKALPASILKIDQSFVRDMLDDPDDLAILEGVLGLATAFRRKVIAEGVETVEHGTLLLQLGCELAQGYGIARPMPAHELLGWTTTWQPDPLWINLPSVSRDDLPVIFASVEHRAWIVAIRSFLKGECDPPPLNHHQCRFGTWLEGEGLARHASKPAFHTIELLHRQVHALAAELLELNLHGRKKEARVRLDELYQLRDALLEQLKTLVQGNRQLTE